MGDDTTGAAGLGLTVMVKDWDGPVHPLLVGETVIVAVTGEEVLFTELKEGIGPLPLAASPIEVVVFVQEKLVPGNVLVTLKLFTTSPAQTVLFAGTVAPGEGLTKIVWLEEVVPHSLDTDKLSVCVPVELKDMLPGEDEEEPEGVAPGKDHAKTAGSVPKQLLTDALGVIDPF